jgi:hypothetical protein
VVIEDTEIRSVHTLNLPNPAQARSEIAFDDFIIIGAKFIPMSGFEGQDVCEREMPNSVHAFCPFASLDGAMATFTKEKVVKSAGFDVCCADDKANSAECHGEKSCANSCPAGEKKTTGAQACAAMVQVPEIGRAEIAGEWLIPRDEVLLIGFGPHTVADENGKAVVRERLAMISAEDVAMPTAAADSEPLGLPGTIMTIPKMTRSSAGSFPSLPTPALPSRSLPQGVNADGTPATLPPLPSEEKVDVDSSNSSAEPRPSLQSKKSAKSSAPEGKPTAKPSASLDSKTSKAAFTLPKGLFKQSGLPQLTLPNLQFVMPLQPFALKLPFNQKLELELIGRVVADTDVTSISSDGE